MFRFQKLLLSPLLAQVANFTVAACAPIAELSGQGPLAHAAQFSGSFRVEAGCMNMRRDSEPERVNDAGQGSAANRFGYGFIRFRTNPEGQ